MRLISKIILLFAVLTNVLLEFPLPILLFKALDCQRIPKTCPTGYVALLPSYILHLVLWRFMFDTTWSQYDKTHALFVTKLVQPRDLGLFIFLHW
jgi:hypothetical protein